MSIEIKVTTERELDVLKKLWADGDVMHFVGFPNGLHKTDEEMKKWYEWLSQRRPTTNHYSVFENGVYCGESFFGIDEEHKSASLDIKLLRFARGRGIAAKALSFAIEEAFRNGAERVWVDPVPENKKAIALYERLGFERKERPEYLICPEGFDPIYMELVRR